MQTAKPTIKDVAAASGVSITTVSRALNGRTDQMSAETRLRVLEAVEKLNYVPNRLASSLKNECSHTLGVIVSNIMNPFFTAVVRGVQDYVIARGYEIFIYNTDDNPELEAQAHKALLSRRVDGLIVTKCSRDTSTYAALAAEQYPFVLVDRAVTGLAADTVVVDNATICERVMNRLFQLGHRRIGIISPPLNHIEPRIERVQGCRKAAHQHDVELAPELIVQADFHGDAAVEPIRRLLTLKTRPTALFVLNTFLAVTTLKVLRECGLRLPQDVSFVMFDDPEWSEVVQPKISAVRQPTYEIGRIAARLVLERIERKTKPVERICLNAEFVERESVAVAAAARSQRTPSAAARH